MSEGITEKERRLKELELESFERKLARKSFKAFVQFVHKREFKKEFIWNFHNQEIADALQKLEDNDNQWGLLINIPPRHGKSAMVTIYYPVWKMLRDTDAQFISTGYSAELTQGFSREARDIYCSNSVELLFPQRPVLKADQNTQKDWKTVDGGRYYATSTLGSLTGVGGNRVIVDDGLKPLDAMMGTATNLNKLNDWFSNTLVSRLNSTIKIDESGNKYSVPGKVIIVAQRLADNDLPGYLLEKYKDEFKTGEWASLVMPAIAEVDDKYRKKGDALFPQLFPVARLRQLEKAMTIKAGSNHFEAQYQQNPVNMRKAVFKDSYFEYYNEAYLGEKHLDTVIAIDPAISEEQTADDTAVACVSKDNSERYYVRDVKNERYTPDEMTDVVFSMQSAHGCPVVIEAVGGWQALSILIKREMKIRQHYFVLHEIKSRGNKITRIKATLQPLYANHRISHNEPLKNSDLEKQLVRFPKHAHDDCPDAVETAITALSDEEITNNDDSEAEDMYARIAREQQRELAEAQRGH